MKKFISINVGSITPAGIVNVRFLNQAGVIKNKSFSWNPRYIRNPNTNRSRRQALEAAREFIRGLDE